MSTPPTTGTNPQAKPAAPKAPAVPGAPGAPVPKPAAPAAPGVKPSAPVAKAPAAPAAPVSAPKPPVAPTAPKPAAPAPPAVETKPAAPAPAPVPAAVDDGPRQLITLHSAFKPLAPGEPEINKVFRMCMEKQGSDLHLKVGQPVMMRLKGDICRMETPIMTQEDMETLIYPTLTPKLRKILDDEGGVDYSHVVGKDECRFRVSLFRQRTRLSMVSRRVNNSIPSFEKLGLPPIIEKLCFFPEGMVILAGVTGSGKSTTIAAMLDYVNSKEPIHILSIEDPIEFTYTDKVAVINQREIGLDCINWQKALKDAVRQDPDVILIGELRDRDTFEAAVHAAETGHLVFGTIHAANAGTSINRILDLFPPEMHHGIRQALANNLKAVVAQKLVKSIRPGVSRVPTNEIMIVNPTIRKLIAEEMDRKIPDAIRIGFNEGMQDFTESLRLLVEKGDIDKATALEMAPNPDQLKMALKGIKVAAPGIL